MAGAAQRVLHQEGWGPYHDCDYDEDYFNVTAIESEFEVNAMSVSFEHNTNQMRHLLLEKRPVATRECAC